MRRTNPRTANCAERATRRTARARARSASARRTRRTRSARNGQARPLPTVRASRTIARALTAMRLAKARATPPTNRPVATRGRNPLRATRPSAGRPLVHRTFSTSQTSTNGRSGSASTRPSTPTSSVGTGCPCSGSVRVCESTWTCGCVMGQPASTLNAARQCVPPSCHRSRPRAPERRRPVPPALATRRHRFLPPAQCP